MKSNITKNLKKEKPSSLKLGPDRESSYKQSSVSRYYVIKKSEGNFEKANPFAIDRELTKSVGRVLKVRKIRDGLLVEVNDADQIKLLSSMKSFLGSVVSVTLHNTLNYCKGVISSPELLNCTVDEIKDGLSSQGVIDVRRLTTMRDGKRTDTSSCVITVDSPVLPSRVKIGYLSIPVRTYYAPPLRCFNCQQFGHTSLTCVRDATCVCGRPKHGELPCADPMKCVNCGGPHSARSRECSVFVRETAIQKVKADERISYAEAKRKVAEKTRNVPSVSYSSVASRPSAGASPANCYDPIEGRVLRKTNAR